MAWYGGNRRCRSPRQRRRLGGEDLGHRVVADRAVEAVLADAGDLERPQGRVLRLQGDDGAPDPQREAPSIRRRWILGFEKAAHADRGEAGRLVPLRPFGDPGLASPGAGWLAEEHDRPEQFVGFLRGRADQEAELVPVVGGLAARSRAGWHRSSLGGTRSPRRAGARRGMVPIYRAGAVLSTASPVRP